MNKLDQPLDALIKSRGSNKKGGRGGRGGRGRGGGGRRGGNRGSRGGGRNAAPRGGYGPARSTRSQNGRQQPYARPVAPVIRKEEKLAPSPKVMISNLDSEITADDVGEIFNQIGKVKNSAVHYDQNGRSLGTGEVIFSNANDAKKAVKEFNKAEVDGRPMFLQIAAKTVMVPVPQKQAAPAPAPRRNTQNNVSGGRNGNNNRGRNNTRGKRGGAGRGGRGGRGGKGAGRGGKKQAAEKPMTAEQLDAQMDAYFSKGASGGGGGETVSAGQPAIFTGQPDISTEV